MTITKATFVAKYIVLLYIALDVQMALAAANDNSVQNILQYKSHDLIPRKAIFGNPDKTSVCLSPDGSKIAFLAPINQVLNLWVTDGNDIQLKYAKPVTHEKVRDISREYYWAFNSNYILYSKDQKGDENFHIYRVNIKTGHIKDLTPFHEVSARLIDISHLFPNEVLIILNKRDPKWFDIYRLNIISGKLTLIEENHQFVGFTTDANLQVRVAQKHTDEYLEHYIKNSKGEWKFYEKVPLEDEASTLFIGFNRDGNIAYKVDSQGRDKAAIYAIDLNTKKKTLLAENDKVDCANLLVHPYEFVPQAYSYEYTKPKWVVLDQRIKKDFAYLKKQFSDTFDITSRTLADDKWIIRSYSDTKPSCFYLYKRDPVKNLPLSLNFLFTTKSELIDLSLAPMYPLIIKSRDGLDLVCYLTLPLSAKPTKPVPMVLYVHGGPWLRNSWGIDGYHQWLANRGYAVLSVNYRGSSGFGKAFLNAGNKEWGRKMQYDLIDAVNWTIKHKIADPKKIAIMGYSYGGYATLVGLTHTPDVFCCGVSIVGGSNLVTFIENIAPYWKSMMMLFKKRVGDIDTEVGRKMLRERSPLFYVDRIKKPLLIMHGEHDPRVKKFESDQIVNKMRQNNIPVTYVVYHDEGHGIVREPNSFSAHAIIEKFLAKNLGGLYEPAKKSEFKGANYSVMSK